MFDIILLFIITGFCFVMAGMLFGVGLCRDEDGPVYSGVLMLIMGSLFSWGLFEKIHNRMHEVYHTEIQLERAVKTEFGHYERDGSRVVDERIKFIISGNTNASKE